MLSVGRGLLSSTAFDTEQCCDHLAIDTDGTTTKYSGDLGPSRVAVGPDATVSWSSDLNTVASGWRICLQPADGPNAPPPPPNIGAVAVVVGNKDICGIDPLGHTTCWGGRWGAPSGRGTNYQAGILRFPPDK